MNMNRQVKMAAIAVITMYAVQACIIEDRSTCPSYLTLDFSETPDCVSDIHLVLSSNDGYLFRDTIAESWYQETYVIPVKRGETTVSVFGNADGMIYDGGYRVKEAHIPGELYTFFTAIDCHGDLSFQKVTVLKNYIGLYIRVTGRQCDSLSVLLESSSAGYDLKGGILEGRFIHRPANIHVPTAGEEYFEFTSRVTRQKNDDLTLSVLNASGKTIAVIPLSPYLEKAGIDMNGKELEDLYMTVDVALSSLTLSIDGWDSTNHTEIIF